MRYWIGQTDQFDRYAFGAPANDAAPESAAPAATLGPPAAVVRLVNRGRLRNGNPSGDYLAAPRCGARTRAGCSCRQPAMKNGRCRFHGGKSTGPRTAAGLERSRRARLVHGLRSAEVIDLRKAAAAAGRRLRALLSGGIPAGHGLQRHVLHVAAGLSSRPRAAGEGWGGGAGWRVAGNVVPLSAGHGLHRHESQSAPPHLRSPLARASGRGPG